MLTSTLRRQRLGTPPSWHHLTRAPRRAQIHNTSPARSKATPDNHSPSSSPVKPSLLPTYLSIPGPSWYWVQPLTYPFRAYGRAQQRSPYIVQITSSIVIYFLGDLASQSIQKRTQATAAPQPSINNSTAVPPQSSYDPYRAVRSVTIGALSSIPSYRFFIWLSCNFNVANRPYTSLILKVIFNQLVFAPCFNTYFFSMQSLLSFSEGPQPYAAWRRVCDTVPTSLVKSCQFWPAVTAFSFTFVPVQHRSVFAGVVAIGWQSYLGMLNQRAVTKERLTERRPMVKALA